jgi:hypothetical protein
MTATNHAVFGAFVGSIIPDPIYAIPLAFLSHFALDSLPHYGAKDLKTLTKVLRIDASIATLFLFSLFLLKPDHWQIMIIGGLFAMGPDLMWLPGYIRDLRKIPKKGRNWIMKLHGHVQTEYSYGLIFEIPWLVAILTILLITSVKR